MKNNKFNNPNSLSRQFSSKIEFVSTLTASLLIFIVVIIPLAGADVWSEASAIAVIFVLSALNARKQVSANESRRLIAPLNALAIYSFLQGFSIFIFSGNSFLFPTSFDPTASIWSGFKILAFACLLGLLLKTAARYIRFFVWSLVVTGNFFAVFGIARYFLQDKIFDLFALVLSEKLDIGIGFGTYFNQNHFALLMLMVFGLNIGLLKYARVPKSARLALFAASLISWTALVLTGSRGGIIGSFAEIALLIFLPVIQVVKSKRQNSPESAKSYRKILGKQFAVLIITFGILIAGIVFIGQDRVVERFEDIPGQVGGVTRPGTFRRTDAWLAALQITKDFPVFGIGFGGFQIAVSQYINISGQIVPQQAHNDYLELAASGGLVAIALAVWFLFGFFSTVKKRFAESPDNFSGAARAGAICAIAGVAFHSFFDFGLQIMANILFFAGLLFIAVHKLPQIVDSNNESGRNFSAILKYLFPLLCLIMAVSAAFFGFARYRNERIKSFSGNDLVENNLFRIPFDANYFETKAAVYENAGNFELAALGLKKTLEYRPNDYDLWIKLGRLENVQDRSGEAENAFRRAIELAPNYGKPYFFYGNFLVESNRRAEGFQKLRTASRRNPQYLTEVISIIWSKNGGNAAETIGNLLPIDAFEKEKLSIFLIEKNEFQAVTELNCGDLNLSDRQRFGLIHQLLEKKRFYFAARLYKQNCEFSEPLVSEIEDGSFENKNVEENTGFGWRVPSFSGNTAISFDDQNPAKGLSLRFDFNGQDNSHAMLSQLVVVEKSRRYRLNFAYKTKEIVTGGVPVIQVIFKKPDSATSEGIAGETKLSLKEQNWVQASIEFETDNLTEAVEIRLNRQTCSETLCPIFGNLWLDDFHLQKKN